MGKDLGTYHAKVKLSNGKGFIAVCNTGRRYCGGSPGFHPIDADFISPGQENEAELVGEIVHYYTDGNGGYSSSLALLLSYAYPAEDIEELYCGAVTLEPVEIWIIRPDGTEFMAWNNRQGTITPPEPAPPRSSM